LTQDERRELIEAQTRHIGNGMAHLPATAQRLHHCRDVRPDGPFGFITWFECAPGEEAAFDDLRAALRASPEWASVDREVDLRMTL
jgi:hypothetical protein